MSSQEIFSTVNQKSPLLILGIPFPSTNAAFANLSASSLYLFPVCAAILSNEILSFLPCYFIKSTYFFVKVFLAFHSPVAHISIPV